MRRHARLDVHRARTDLAQQAVTVRRLREPLNLVHHRSQPLDASYRASHRTAGVRPLRSRLSSRRSTLSAGRARPLAATNAESQVMNFGSAFQW